MVSQSTVNLIQASGKRYLKAHNALTNSWQGRCGCQSPGLKLKCQTCPYFIEYIELLQLKVETLSPQPGFAVVLPPKLAPPYSEAIKQRCLQMYFLGYSIGQIQKLTGINSFGTLRRWFREAGLYKKAEEYSKEQKQESLSLYRQGKTPLEIEEITRVSGDVIRAWVSHAGIARPKNHYSLEQQQQAIALYAQGIAYSEIQTVTGVPPSMVRKFASQAKVSRKRKGKAPTYTPEFKQHCLDLLAKGKKPVQIEELLGVSADTVRRWLKKHREKLKSLEEQEL